eukprot:CAMPEP_0174719248 /NCGR_PEP_ID=MMETSP1094-20130205/30867_1 /TAXON_ID=156173 /ORGANISM="Chrysochromulina brevifilum, Strain UTEX LB 985" /LENGTH=459 /DNA_ID=CAMNT_0015919519 /DNA_START=43 /DNA_END=1422 /DNA_ORIENTATION=+
MTMHHDQRQQPRRELRLSLTDITNQSQSHNAVDIVLQTGTTPHTDNVSLAPDFALGAEIGRGSYAVCYAARRKACTTPTFDLCAKVIKVKEEEPAHQARTELEILQVIGGLHPSLPHLVASHELENEHVVLITERGEMNLKEAVRSADLSEEQVRPHFLAVAGALHALHRSGFAHLDVKPANIMLVRGKAMLIDFGMVEPLSTGKMAFGLTSYAMRRLVATGKSGAELAGGTPSYFAPEVVLADRAGVECPATAARDAWALGATMLTVLRRGHNPFHQSSSGGRSSKETTEDAILAGASAALAGLSGRISPALHHLLARLLHVDPISRYGVDEIATHPWARPTGAAAALCPLSKVVAPSRPDSPKDVASTTDDLAAGTVVAAEATTGPTGDELVLPRRRSSSSLALADLRHDLKPNIAAARLRLARTKAGQVVSMAREQVVEVLYSSVTATASFYPPRG